MDVMYRMTCYFLIDPFPTSSTGVNQSEVNVGIFKLADIDKRAQILKEHRQSVSL